MNEKVILNFHSFLFFWRIKKQKRDFSSPNSKGCQQTYFLGYVGFNVSFTREF